MTNKEIIKQGFSLMSSHDLSGFAAIIAPNYVNHDMPAPGPGPEGFKAVVGAFIQAFPDFKAVLEDQIGEGDKVANRGYFTGTHRGDFMGIPPTGKTVKVKFIDWWRVENGKAVENWVQLDNLGLMQQLGVIPIQ